MAFLQNSFYFLFYAFIYLFFWNLKLTMDHVTFITAQLQQLNIDQVIFIVYMLLYFMYYT